MSARRPLLRLAPHFRHRARLLGVCLVGSLVGSALSLVNPWLVAHAIDVDIAGGDLPGLARTAGMFLGVLLASFVVGYGSRVGIELVAQDAMARLKRTLFAHLVDHDLSFFDRHTSGRLMTRVQGDADALRVLFTEVVLAAPADLLLVGGMFVVLLVEAPTIGLIVVAVLPIYIGAFLLFRRIATPRFLAVRGKQAALTGMLAEHVRAMPTLIGYDRAGWSRGRADALNAEVLETKVHSDIAPIVYLNSLFTVRSLGTCAVLVAGGLQVHAGALTIGDLVMGLGYMRLMFNPLMRLSFQVNTLERGRAAGTRILELLDEPRQLVDRPEARSWPGLTREVRLEGVRFAYPGSDGPGPEVIGGIDLVVPAGANLGIVGPTGGGKTTLINLLLRFRDPTAGAVTIDGVDLRDVRLEDLRRKTALVLQDVHLFPGTVLENLGGNPDAAAAALDRLGLDVDLDMIVGDGGGNLSRGERQLLTFARALVDDPELLVLDEATSAVDPATEARVQAAVARLQEGRTTVTIAHRLHTVRHCDTIAVLVGGHIVEQGTHDALLTVGGVYAALHELQAGEAA